MKILILLGTTTTTNQMGIQTIEARVRLLVQNNE